VVLVSGLPLAEDFARQCLVAVSVGWGLACLARSFRSGRGAPSAPGAGKDRDHVMQVAAGAGERLGSSRSMRVGVPDPVVALVPWSGSGDF
jgi:hypothetical protein